MYLVVISMELYQLTDLTIALLGVCVILSFGGFVYRCNMALACVCVSAFARARVHVLNSVNMHIVSLHGIHTRSFLYYDELAGTFKDVKYRTIVEWHGTSFIA